MSIIGRVIPSVYEAMFYNYKIKPVKPTTADIKTITLSVEEQMREIENKANDKRIERYYEEQSKKRHPFYEYDLGEKKEEYKDFLGFNLKKQKEEEQEELRIKYEKQEYERKIREEEEKRQNQILVEKREKERLEQQKKARALQLKKERIINTLEKPFFSASYLDRYKKNKLKYIYGFYDGGGMPKSAAYEFLDRFILDIRDIFNLNENDFKESDLVEGEKKHVIINKDNKVMKFFTYLK